MLVVHESKLHKGTTRQGRLAYHVLISIRRLTPFGDGVGKSCPDQGLPLTNARCLW